MTTKNGPRAKSLFRPTTSSFSAGVWVLALLAAALLSPTPLMAQGAAQDNKLRIIAFGAHPDLEGDPGQAATGAGPRARTAATRHRAPHPPEGADSIGKIKLCIGLVSPWPSSLA